LVACNKAKLFYGTALLAVVVDQVTKAIARSALSDGLPVVVIPGFFDLKLSFNPGAAFGMLPNWAPLFMVVALVAAFAIVRLRGNRPQSKILTVGLALVLGGALGNLIDRLCSPDHVVTDFLSFFVSTGSGAHAWPTFNIADAAVVVGAILMFFYVYIVERGRVEPVDDAPNA